MSMLNKMRAVALGSFLIGIVVTLTTHWFLNRWTGDTVQRLCTVDHKHCAELKRRMFLDLNFLVKLNGKNIFMTEDFMPNDTLPHRETLVWDDSGKILLLEIAGRRIYGYDTEAGRQLRNDELLAIKVSPIPLSVYQYAGEWPGIGKVD